LFAAARREQALTSRGIGALVQREIGTDFAVSRFQGSSSVFLKDSVPSSSSASASSSSLVLLAHLLLFFFFFMLLEEAGMCVAQAPWWISFSSSSCPKAQRDLESIHLQAFLGSFTKLDDLQEGLIHALGRGGVAVEPSS
jgi:hypothetical protein